MNRKDQPNEVPTTDRNPNRRHFLVATLGVAALTRASSVLADCLRAVRTDEGPFYPKDTIPALTDLTRRASHGEQSDGRANGQVLYVAGRVTDADCAPIEGARVEVWQCDTKGLYWHPAAAAQDELDPHFAYFAHAITAVDGRYAFKTIVPSRYTFMGMERAPHIHFKVKHASFRELVTEMYFAGESDDEIRSQDRVWHSRPETTRRHLIVAPVDAARLDDAQGVDLEKGSLACAFDLQLDARGA